MRRRISATIVVYLLLAALVPATALATGRSDHERGDKSAPVYMSLGDSLAAGSLADENGNTTSSSRWSYTDQLFRMLEWRFGRRLVHDKLGCDGETTAQLLGGVNAAGQPSKCKARYDTGSQMGDALAAIETGDVVLVSIDIGADDILQAQSACGGDPACIAGAIPGIASNVGQIVGTLRGAGYDGPILGMTYYNPQLAIAIGFYPGVAGQQTPDLALAQATNQLAAGFNGALSQAYGAFGVEVVDVYVKFNSADFGDDRPANGIPDNVDVICALTSMCPEDAGVKANIHLNRRGYLVVAGAFLRAFLR